MNILQFKMIRTYISASLLNEDIKESYKSGLLFFIFSWATSYHFCTLKSLKLR